MHLGGPIHREVSTPTEWANAVTDRGYGAAYCPIDTDADEETRAAYAEAAADAGVVIAEVPGFGPNPLHPDPEKRRAAVAELQDRLALADDVGARCCVNIAGTRNPDQWDGPHPENLTGETFDRIVESVREIVDGVDPDDATYTLETMPWIYPDSTESYRRLLEAVDREQFGVHFDPVNLVCSPQRYFATGELVREFAEELGEHVRSCHLKDIQLRPELTTHLDEVRPGTGGFDHRALLEALDGLDEVPVMLEHLETEQEYERAAQYVRSVADDAGLTL